ncbi:hypothetical protein Lesp02_52610 [Lentzea sp. NBRC 105346]|uniref:DUF3558 family protein n=1 Tax=Lentzea sp. NBRC 105346 TaxID=3032205 RepID=UPI0024A0D4C2|nr:DUF3558 family protein [Lentzea sp. NBRC 105346]GLZ33073.1 hypothetical protein Lesp02_52610 [Lentzea sp. NBRC 105346]
MRPILLALLAAVLTGCGTPAAAPQASSAPPTTSKSVWKGTSVKEPPPVTETPLKLGAYAKDPCEVIKKDWLEDFGLSRLGTSKNDNGKVRCWWDPLDKERGTAIEVVFLHNRSGLFPLYQRPVDDFKYFRPGTISGYPSVEATGKTVADNVCATHVVTAEFEGFTVYATVLDPKADEYSNPCTASNEAAAAVIERLKAPR